MFLKLGNVQVWVEKCSYIPARGDRLFECDRNEATSAAHEWEFMVWRLRVQVSLLRRSAGALTANP